MALQRTLPERFAAAWQAFKQTKKFDPSALQKYETEQRIKVDASLLEIPAASRAFVANFGGAVTDDEGAVQFINTIAIASIEAQGRLIKNLVRGNARWALTPAVNKWVERNSAVMVKLAKDGSL